MEIKFYKESDLEAVVALFTASVHCLAAGYYDATQRAAWAPRPPRTDGWRERLAALRILIAVDDGRPMGCIGYDSGGYIDLLYTAPEYAREGVASRLYLLAEAALMSAGVRELSTKASAVARAFFERQGFEVEEEEMVWLRGGRFQRYRMRKVLAAAPANSGTAGDACPGLPHEA